MSAPEIPSQSPSVSTPGVARPRSRRERPAKAALSREAIVVAALEILRTDGLEAVSMRRVAAALDTGAASLYVYVPNREGLLGAMLDHVVAQIELEVPDPSRWREQLHGLLGRIQQALIDHPGLAALTFADVPTSETVLASAENLLGLLLAGGLDPQDAAWACDIFTLLVAAVVNEADLRGPDGEQAIAAEAARTLASLAPERFPLLTAHVQPMITGDPGERFRFAVDLILDGMVARAARQS